LWRNGSEQLQEGQGGDSLGAFDVFLKSHAISWLNMRSLAILVFLMGLASGLSTGKNPGRSPAYSSAQDQSNSTSTAAIARARRRNQSKDLKKLIQELEESDYSNYGSWGNFRSRKPNDARVVTEFGVDEYQMNRPDDANGDSLGLNIGSGSDDFQSPYDDFVNEESHYVADFQNQEFEEPYWQHQNQARIDAGSTRSSQMNRFASPRGAVVSGKGIAERSTSVSLGTRRPHLKFRSITKLTTVAFMSTFLSFLSVPRNLPLTEFNSAFQSGLLVLSGSFLWPIVLLVVAFRMIEVDINKVIDHFVFSYFAGYPALMILEFILITVVRLSVLNVTEPTVFDLTSKVPGIVVPWKLGQLRYLPSRFTLILSSFLSSCVVAPIVEELFKLKLLRRALRNNADKKQTIPLVAGQPLQSVKTYLVYSTAVCMGIKVADNTNRILKYLAPNQPHKSFFAVLRGVFPVQELCGGLTALAIAHRDVRGITSRWDLSAIGPAVLLHSFAVLRGLKPLVSISLKPWEELQLHAWNVHSSFRVVAAGLSLAWLMVVTRVFFHLLKRSSSLEQMRRSKLVM